MQRKGQKNFHPFALFENNPTDEEWLEEATAWLVDEAQNGFLLCKAKNGKQQKCNCFIIFQDKANAEAVAEYMLFYGKCRPAEKDRIMMDIIRWQEKTKPPDTFAKNCHFKVPFVVSPDDDEDIQIKKALSQHYICQSALQHLFAFGRKKMKRIRADLNNGLVIPRRPRVGKANRRDLEKEGIIDDLHVFFDTLKDFEEPRATRFVREITGVGIREEETVDLPSYMTKRGLYRQFCYARGVIVEATGTGKRTYKDRTDSDWMEQNGEILPCPSWTSFCRFWKDQYPSLRIQKPIKDICGECFKFYMENKSNFRRRKAKDDASSDSSASGDEESSVEVPTPNIDEHNQNGDDVVLDDDSNAPDQEDIELQEEEPTQPLDLTISSTEVDVLRAANHVRDAIAQRDLVARLRQRAIDTKDFPPNERTYLFYFDYAQNLECPYFGHEQPGETYYYSPLSISTFGICDGSHDDYLHAFCYHEGEGQKGGNNVVSMLDYYLRRKHNVPAIAPMSKTEVWGDHIVFVCDNCGGQNKNRMVIRYLLYLAESRKFKKVSLIFLIVGHTKNPCDRMFNLLKIGYRKRDIFSVEDLVDILNENEHVSAERFSQPRCYFRDWDMFLHKYYSRPQSVKKWHIFEIDGTINKPNSRTLMTLLRSAQPGSMKMTQQFRSRRRGIEHDNNREAAIELLLEGVPRLDPPGIRAIKKNELWAKYRKLVPSKYHNLDIYQPPSSAEAAMLKQQQQLKDKAKREDKDHTRKRKRDSDSSKGGQGVAV